MTNPLTRKLEAFAPLSHDDKRLLDDVVRTARDVGPREDLIREGDNPRDVQLVLKGFACRYKLLANGQRQITAYLIPGDFCDLHVFILKAMDHSIATLSPCRVAPIPRRRVLELTERPAIARALWWATLVDEAVLREWLLNIGARPAEERVAHLLCELLVRLRTVGLSNSGAYELPLTQTDLADTVGVTHIHVNRMLQRLRSAGAITLKDNRLVIHDVDGLMAFAGFDPSYLHLSKRNGAKAPCS